MVCGILFILIKGDSVSCTNMNEMEDTMLSETIQALNDALRFASMWDLK